MQGELYTAQPFGTQGDQEMDYDKLIYERPEYFVFNGSGRRADQATSAASAKVGETVRIFFGVGGPNLTSSFHVIGEIFDHVYEWASLTAPPLSDVQTVSVPPGGATIVDFKIDRPGHYMLVDHALSRLERGLVGSLIVDGPRTTRSCTRGAPNGEPQRPTRAILEDWRVGKINRWPNSFLTPGCFAGFTSMTPYWLNSRLSPSTAMTRSPLFLNESQVA